MHRRTSWKVSAETYNCHTRHHLSWEEATNFLNFEVRQLLYVARKKLQNSWTTTQLLKKLHPICQYLSLICIEVKFFERENNLMSKHVRRV